MNRTETHGEVAQKLKLCPFCGALNSTERKSCYNCLWHGVFELDPAIVSASVNEIDPDVLFAMGVGLPAQNWRERLSERARLLATAIKHKVSNVLSIRRYTPV